MAFEGLSEKLGSIFKALKNRGKLSEADVKAVMREIRLALLGADVNFKVTKALIANITERCVGTEVLESLTPAQQVIKIVNEELIKIMGTENSRVHFSSKPPSVIMMVGLQGAGKTTHTVKLANYYRKNMSKRPLLVACDIYRPAAILQLQTLAAQVDLPVFTMPEGTDPVTIAKKAVAHAKDHGNDLVFIDTAGRLHIDEQLMGELSAIKAAVNPSEILLTVDSMIGQDAVSVAETFHNQLGVGGVVLTKLDGDTRGGAALSIGYATGCPVKFAGVGEKVNDIEVFHPERMASRILGMGDMLTLIEQAEQDFDEKKIEELERKMAKNAFDLSDYLDQIRQVNKLGSLEKIISMIPGVNKNALKDANIDPKMMARNEAIILSMTAEERRRPEILNASRRKRIAAGSGTRVEDINRLIKTFDQAKKMMKQMNKNPNAFGRGGFPGMPG